MQNYESTGAEAAMAGVFLTFMLFFWAILLIIVIAMWRIFTKAGQPGWASIVPIYSAVVLMRIIGKPDWHFLLYLIPFYNIYIAIVHTNLLSKSFGKGEGFTVGLIFLGIIFYPILAFGDSVYLGPGGAGGASLDNKIDSIGTPAV